MSAQSSSLKDKAIKVLLGMEQEVSRDDRAEAVKELGFSPMTVSRYLRGDVRDIGTAEKLIQFFKPRIKKRNENIAA